jgi:predicted N-acyltransferase
VTALAEVAPEAWDALLERLGLNDVYFRRAYLESASLLGQGRPVYLAQSGQDGGVVFPCLVRDAPDGRADVATPMGYGGPVAAGAAPPVDAFFDEYERWCAEAGIVATFVRFHPLLANQRLAEGHWHLEHIGHSIGWRLHGRSSDDLFAGMGSHHRRLARRALAAGVATSAAAEPADLAAFISLYEDTMRRKGASAFYLFPGAYWELLTTDLREALVRFDAVLDGELAASILCLASEPYLHYHLGCSTEQGQRVGVNHLLFHAAASWAAERGFERLQLGGGVGGFEDSLYDFKRRFDPEGACPAYLGKAVHDLETYLALAGAEAVDYDGYFPAYRAG